MSADLGVRAPMQISADVGRLVRTFPSHRILPAKDETTVGESYAVRFKLKTAVRLSELVLKPPPSSLSPPPSPLLPPIAPPPAPTLLLKPLSLTPPSSPLLPPPSLLLLPIGPPPAPCCILPATVIPTHTSRPTTTSPAHPEAAATAAAAASANAAVAPAIAVPPAHLAASRPLVYLAHLLTHHVLSARPGAATVIPAIAVAPAHRAASRPYCVPPLSRNDLCECPLCQRHDLL
ncbi:hypothetical protein B0H10DRAFT_2225191 [Mycena sp. CBHHK59/15]|nr:hypothetical protein B0H10DRAFT_2225191 [Mycena sp. CBHHK59/15]